MAVPALLTWQDVSTDQISNYFKVGNKTNGKIDHCLLSAIS